MVTFCEGDDPEFPEEFEHDERTITEFQLSIAHNSVVGLETELTHLIDRAKYYNDPPTLEILESLRKSVRYLKKIVE